MDVLDEIDNYISEHELAYGEHAERLKVHVDYRDLKEWLQILAGLLYAYTGDINIARHLKNFEEDR